MIIIVWKGRENFQITKVKAPGTRLEYVQIDTVEHQIRDIYIPYHSN